MLDFKEEKLLQEQLRESKQTNSFLERIALALENKKVTNKCIAKIAIANPNCNIEVYEYKKVKNAYILTYFETHEDYNQSITVTKKSFAVTEESFKKDYEVL